VDLSSQINFLTEIFRVPTEPVHLLAISENSSKGLAKAPHYSLSHPGSWFLPPAMQEQKHHSALDQSTKPAEGQVFVSLGTGHKVFSSMLRKCDGGEY